ncbi:dual specificity protein phosphatase, putative [Entamoeba invadens IP1]|uniref:Dual specificity protein phosphatase, putative n=1 Tax=Entamoeba invadens IP1 TaxID=370355 RepID=A0A0A1U294_ENTIV|nr:dual specificity protein phosphatase, putative [Entamoeba invadens IP1]ELP85633.1 dual specificity protein phosphatase, putative [Entamoeba invadens IP1]|eukprot:XP_004184979.1 dual specificity protein phosphatase, putative [Entamoeba invadens IP1]
MKINLAKAQDIQQSTLNEDPENTLPPSHRINRKELSEIEDWLFISGETTASEPEILEKSEITYVINAAIAVAKMGFPQKFKYLAFDMSDDTEQDLSSFIFHSIDFMTKLRRESPTNKCLVHCHAGISRSVSLVLSYFMYEQHMSFEEALAYVKTRRKVACPNISFECQLKLFQELLKSKKPLHCVYCKLRRHVNSSIFPLYIAHCLTVGSETSFVADRTTLQMFSSGDSPYIPLDSLFDSRGCFVVFTMEGTLYIWKGSLSQQSEMEACEKYCEQVERIIGVAEHSVIKENEESETFLKEAHLYPPQRRLHLHKRYDVEYPVIKNERLLLRYPDWRVMEEFEIENETETPIIIFQPKTMNPPKPNFNPTETAPFAFSMHEKIGRVDHPESKVEKLDLHNVKKGKINPLFHPITPRTELTEQKDNELKEQKETKVGRRHFPKKRCNTILSGTESEFSPQKPDTTKYKIVVFIPMQFPRFSTMVGKLNKVDFELLTEKANCVQVTGEVEIVDQFIDSFKLNKEEIEIVAYFTKSTFGTFVRENL